MMESPNPASILIMPVRAHGEFIGGVLFHTPAVEPTERMALNVLTNLFAHQIAVVHALFAAHETQIRLESQMLEQSKLASLGQMSAGVAHEINQPLTFISALLQRIYERCTADSQPTAQWLEQNSDLALKEVERIRLLTQDLLVFARGSGANLAEKKVRTNLRKVWESTARILKDEIQSSGVDVSVNTTEEPAFVDGASNQLQQVFVNLMQNALNAVKSAGEGQRGKIQIELGLLDDSSAVCWQITDNGCGMSEDIQRQMYEPFYTTHPSDGGTGLGLSIVHGIILGHSGWIECESTEGKGTDIRVFLPRAN